MPLRSFVGAGVLIGGLLVAVSCSGPSSVPSDASEEGRSRVYHVRLDVTKEKKTANRMLGRALEWWNERSETASARPLSSANDSPVSVVWRVPYYRVQIGPFASRTQADSVLQVARSAFPGAFVSPE